MSCVDRSQVNIADAGPGTQVQHSNLEAGILTLNMLLAGCGKATGARQSRAINAAAHIFVHLT